MDIDDVLALVKAGFSKQEIEAFSAENAENETPNEVQTPAETPAEVVQNPAETNAPAQEVQQPNWTDVMRAIKTLTESVQAANRQTAQMPAEPTATVEETLRAISGIPATNKKHK